MKPFWALTGVTALLSGLIYGIAVIIALVVVPVTDFDTDVTTREQKLWGNPARYAVFNQAHFVEDTDRIVLLGASTVREGLRPGVIDDSLPGWTVDGLGLSGALMNVREVEDAIQIVQDAQPIARSRRTVYVLGVTYTLFAEDIPNTDNPTATEMLRHHYVREPDGDLRTRLPIGASPFVSAVYRPLEFIRAAPRVLAQIVLTPELKIRLKSLMGIETVPGTAVDFSTFIATQKDLDAVVLPDAMRTDLLRQRIEAVGGDRPLSDQQFRTLDALIRVITERGDAIVIVDLPLPDWHTSGLPIRQASYRDRLSAALADHADNPRVGYLDLSGLNAGEAFYDSAHAKPRTRLVWSREVGFYLRGFTESLPGSANAG